MQTDWSTITVKAFQDALIAVLEFLPKLIVAIVVFVIGWVIAAGIGKLTARLLKAINFDKLFSQSGWRDALESADIRVSPSEFVGAIVKWVLVIVVLLFSVDVMCFSTFADFLKGVIAWLPNVVIAAAIFVVSIIIADILEKLIKSSVKKIGIKYSQILGAFVRGAIYVFAIFAILAQLGVAETIIDTFVMGFVGMFALAFGLAFGLGGRDAAADVIRGIRNKLTDK